MKKKIKNFFLCDLEKLILQNITRISFYLIIILLILQIFFYLIWEKFLEIKDVITIFGAIIIFWYWYRTYERNKELDIIEKYTNEYDNIISVINKESNKNNYNKLLNFWYKEFYMYHQWYINHKLWSEWDIWIKRDINDYFKNKFNILPKDWITEYESWDVDYNDLWKTVENLIYSDTFFLSLYEFIKYGQNTRVLNNDMQFNEYIIDKLEKIVSEWDFFISEDPEYDDPGVSKNNHDRDIFQKWLLKIIRQDLK